MGKKKAVLGAGGTVVAGAGSGTAAAAADSAASQSADAAASSLTKAVKKCDIIAVREVLESVKGSPGALKKLANVAGAKGSPVLLQAVDSGEDDIVQTLLGAGADANAAEPKGKRQSALHAACWNETDVIIQQLLNEGASPLAKDADGRTPLHVAAAMASKEVFMLLVKGDNERRNWVPKKKGEEDEEAEEDGDALPVGYGPRTAEQSVQYLTVQDNEGATPLHLMLCELASATGFPVLVAEVLAFLKTVGESEAKSVLQVASKTGQTAMHYFALSCLSRGLAVRLATDLLALGGSVTAADEDGNTPAHIAAAMHESADVLKVMLSKFGGLAKAPVNVVDGNTIVHMAATNRNAEVLEFLLKDDTVAESVAPNKAGLTVVRAALESGNRSHANVLADKGLGKREEITQFDDDKATAEAEEDGEAEEAGGDYSGAGNNAQQSGVNRAQASRKAARKGADSAADRAAQAVQNRNQESADAKAAKVAKESGPGAGAYFIALLMFLGMALPLIDWLMGGGPAGSNARRR